MCRLVARSRRGGRRRHRHHARPDGPEEKLFLGWLDYTTVNAGGSGTFTLGPSQHPT